MAITTPEIFVNNFAFPRHNRACRGSILSQLTAKLVTIILKIVTIIPEYIILRYLTQNRILMQVCITASRFNHKEAKLKTKGVIIDP
jgi:hypothetical protein